MKNWLSAIVAAGLAAGLAFWLLRSSPPLPTTRADQLPLPTFPAPIPSKPAVPVPSAPTTASSPEPPAKPGSPAPPSPGPVPSSAASAKAPPAVLPSSSAPAVEVVPALPPATLLENMRTTVRQYGLMFAGNPVGNNAEITKALNGDNPKQVNFLGPDGNRVNEKGELVDSWGTPYFFHQLSAMEMEIRSAGPDRIMWTTDDLVIK